MTSLDACLPGCGKGEDDPMVVGGTCEHLGADIIASVREETIGYVNREVFDRSEEHCTLRRHFTDFATNPVF